MSKPPRPHYRNSVIDDGAAFRDHGDYLPLDFSGFVEIERSLLAEVAEMSVTGEEGDFADTLVELSALLGHALGVYQDLYSREAFVSTAGTPRSLVRHARRLAFTPDPGLAAEGFVALTIGENLQGTVPEGFALASSPRGEVKAQTFETLADIEVDAARNEVAPTHARTPVQLAFVARQARFRLAGVDLELEPGDPGLLVAEPSSWLPVRVVLYEEEGGETVVTVRLEPGVTVPAPAPAGNYRFLAKPATRLHLFGWNADALQFPASRIRSSGAYSSPNLTLPPPSIAYGYRASTEDGGVYNSDDVYLSAELSESLAGERIWVSRLGQAMVAEVSAEQGVTVAFIRGQIVAVSAPVVQDGDVTLVDSPQRIENNLSATSTALRVRNSSGANLARSELALAAPLLAGWQLNESVVPDEPNPSAAVAPLDLAADFGAMRPGSHVCFSTLDGSFDQIVEIRRVVKPAPGRTEIDWVGVTVAPAGGWKLNNLRVLGNLVRVSHGETVEEILGGSDGTTPFLRFELKKPFVTQAPGVEGGEPAVEVRVNDVAWERVDDLYESTSEDRRYRVEIDDQQRAAVVFGNGRNGAVPSSGKKHIRARYRFGLGEVGNVDADQIGRVKKAHPLVESAFNPTASVGGAAPAELHDLQAQATLFIRTFDRAVSVQDHADVALLYPGITRAAARMVNGGVEVIVAAAEGEAADEVAAAVKAFLEARRDSELALTVVSPVAVDVFLSIEIEHDPAYLPENVRLDVQAVLLDDDPRRPGLFAFGGRLLGQAAHRSQVYERVSAVEGVSFMRLTRFDLADETTRYDLLRVTPAQWLRLEPQNLDLLIAPGAVV